MRVEFLCSGTELLRDKVNSNSILVAERLSSLGLHLSQVSTVGDDAADFESALKSCLSRSTVVLCSGGLGPTFDDITRECVSKVLKKPLLFSKKILKQIEGRFARAGRAMPRENERQAYVVRGAVPILNMTGTAPGQIIRLGGNTLILLPGPPRELLPMMDSAVLPYLKKKYPHSSSRTSVLHIFGFPESQIDEMIRPVVEKKWDRNGLTVTFGILAHRSIIDVKATVQGKSASSVKSLSGEIRKSLYRILGSKVYGEDQETLESAVGRLLEKRGETLSLAESCTGGLVASKITNVSGSSDYFTEGFVTYSNESKMQRLGVKKKTLQKYGAVSEPTAREMAQGARNRAKSDWAVSVTGIAGPSGGTKEKPVGTVCFGIASKNGVHAFTKKLSGDRANIREWAALTALDALRRAILGL